MNNDKLKHELLKVTSHTIGLTDSSLSYISSLYDNIKKQFMLGNIDKYAYEYQINLITIIKLQMEKINQETKNTVQKNLGVLENVIQS